MTRAVLLTVLLASGVLLAPGCVQPECARLDYRDAECRVVAENELARLLTSTGVEIRFQDPEVTHSSSWDARGLLEEVEPGLVRARVAAPGRFAISIEPGQDAPESLEVLLENVDPRAVIHVGLEILDPPEQPGPGRRVTVDLSDGEPVWIRGRLDCPERFRIAAMGDVQSNPTQLERIIEHLNQEHEKAEQAGEPLLGLLLLGDVTERSYAAEFLAVTEALGNMPVPTAVIPGNHDTYSRERALYNLTFGPGNHSFDLCGARIVLLDSGSGGLADSIMGRFPELFARDDDQSHLVMGTHYPPYSGRTGAGWGHEDHAHHLMTELAYQDADIALSGHVHALVDYPEIPVGSTHLHEVIVGTAGADQGLGKARYGYLRLTIGEHIEPCFVEVPPAGVSGPQNDPVSDSLPYCTD